VKRLATIGIYDADLHSFLAALQEADVGLVLDVRQRRGVRGTQYAWANAKRLEASLWDDGIAYMHAPELAPTTELRELQYAADERLGEGKRSRTVLAPEYVERFTHEVLGRASLERVLEVMPDDATTALLCVERDPEACHRSLVAAAFGLPVVHLRP
jgi:uncharacterized protein (DUF488 family)